MDDEILFSGSVADGYREYLESVIFRPWAQRLVDLVGLAPGQRVLDVASGTGVVARLAADRVGPTGQITASDLSPSMLAQVPIGYTGSAPLVTLECPATGLRMPDASVDVVFCQQGFPFIPDRTAAAREMRRVLVAGGTAAAAVWLSSARVEPFIVYGEALQAHDVAEPFPGAYSSIGLSMTTAEVEGAFRDAGFDPVELTVDHLELDWPSPQYAVQGIYGTPYGPVLTALDAPTRRAVLADLHRRMSGPDGTAVRHRMTAVLARAVA